MCGDGEAGERGVCRGVECLEDGGGVESVDEEGGAALAWWRVRQEVENLQTRGIGLRGRLVFGSKLEMPNNSRNTCYPYAQATARWCTPYPRA